MLDISSISFDNINFDNLQFFDLTKIKLNYMKNKYQNYYIHKKSEGSATLTLKECLKDLQYLERTSCIYYIDDEEYGVLMALFLIISEVIVNDFGFDLNAYYAAKAA